MCQINSGLASIVTARFLWCTDTPFGQAPPMGLESLLPTSLGHYASGTKCVILSVRANRQRMPPERPPVSTHLMDPTPMPAWSQTFTFLDGEWLEGNHPIVGARTHAFWLGTSVFDGARAFEGVTPDLDQHCARLNRSAKAMCLKPTMSVEAMLELAREGMKKFKPGAELYIRPCTGRSTTRRPPRSRPIRIPSAFASASTRRLCPAYGLSITRSPYAKPLAVTMPIEAKAGCLYPNNARALVEARARGFDNCLMCDMLGNVAELATANVFMAKDGQVVTPMATGPSSMASPGSGCWRFCGRRRGRARGDAQFCRLRRGGRDLRRWQLRQGDAGQTHRWARFAAGAFFHRARKLYWEFAHAG